MAKRKYTVTADYRDLELGRDVSVGETVEVDDDRATKLQRVGVIGSTPLLERPVKDEDAGDGTETDGVGEADADATDGGQADEGTEGDGQPDPEDAGNGEPADGGGEDDFDPEALAGELAAVDKLAELREIAAQREVELPAGVSKADARRLIVAAEVERH